jgi:hypothetical protein
MRWPGCRAAGTMPAMKTTLFALLAASGACAAQAPAPTATSTAPAPAYVDGRLQRPADYRQWIYLSTGFDMSYNPTLRMGHHMFDNVFVDPASWRAFQQTGTWPDKTMFVLEGRGAEDKGSINQAGHYQAIDVMALEIHVKDEARFPGKWAFFVFGGGDDDKTAARVPQGADCYSCHAAHGAVDTTFVQFYPTLLPLAEARGTVSNAWREESKKAGPRKPLS